MKPKKSAIITEPFQEGSGIIFDESQLIQELPAAVGIFKDHYYFGFHLQRHETQEIQKINVPIQQERLCIVTDDYNIWPATDDFQAQYKVKFIGSPLTKKPRWNLPEIESYTQTFQGQRKKYLENHQIEGLIIFDKIKKHYKDKFYFHDEAFYDIHSLWDISTYLFPLFDYFPYIELTGLSGTGKTKVMELSSKISFNGIRIESPTAATIFRIVQSNRPTLYLDEAEKLFEERKGKTEASDIVQLLNSGYQKDAVVPRTEKDSKGKWTVQPFNVFCPKMIASVKGIPDNEPLKRRCILNIMIHNPTEDKRGDSLIQETEEIRLLRSQLYVFALENWIAVLMYYSGQYGEIKNDFGLKAQDFAIWKPLLCVAKIIDADNLYNRIGKAAQRLCELKEMSQYDEDSWELKVFKAVAEVAQSDNYDGTLRISSIQAAQKPLFIKDITETRHGEQANYDRMPNSRKIGWILKNHGFDKYKYRTKQERFYQITASEIQVLFQINRIPIIMSPTSPTSPNIKVIEEKVN